MARALPPPPPPVAVRLGGISRYDRMPENKWLRPLWKKGVQIDSHLCFSMFEWWETVILSLIVFPITALFWYSAFTYFPAHFEYISRRYAYYVFGDETVSTSLLVRAWLQNAAEWVITEGRRLLGDAGAKVEL
ncbi:hypothetical protein VHUM_02410 [Vanrija humicola]|uniref:Uncharacterized protein n=1 Tax=Vanrija humicola TaxID=5417 RepID=A0A7D8V182_VANHU|nr:hypothetical protein VHUM_02410 [Vanrija humicola]